MQARRRLPNTASCSTAFECRKSVCSSPMPSGKNEHALPHRESEYSPTLTPDGKWIVFTSERSGQSDIYRIHPDGIGPRAIDRRRRLRRPGRALTRRQEPGLHLDTRRRLRESLAARHRQPQIPKSHQEPLGQFPAELVSGRPLDRLQFRSRCQSRKIPRPVGAHAIHRHLSDSSRRHRIAPFDQGRRRCRQPVLVLRREARALLRDR